MARTKRPSFFKHPVKKTDVPVTQTMLFIVRDELRDEMQALRTELKGEMQAFKAEIKSEVHQIKLLIEEQNARNIFVLDGLRILFDRQDRIEKVARA